MTISRNDVVDQIRRFQTFLTTITPNLAILFVLKMFFWENFNTSKEMFSFHFLGQRAAQEGLQFGAAGCPEFGIFC